MTEAPPEPRTAGIRTRFTELLGCQVPIQLAPMGGGVVTVDLAAAVSRAGGLGMLQGREPTPLRERLDGMARAQAGPFGVNFVSPAAADRAEIEMAADAARLVEFFWTDPDPVIVGWVHEAGALAGWQVGSAAQARQAADAGCDVIVAQGTEAGGHVRASIGLLPLLSEVLDEVDVPVLAAGGIATPRSMAAALAAGADGVRIGTRFLATPESAAHPDYVAALLTADGESTVLTETFSAGWPDAPHRVLASAVAAALAQRGDSVGSFAGEPLPRLSSRTPSREVTGAINAMALYAGQGVGQIDQVVPAGQIVADLTGGALQLLQRWAQP